MLSITGILTFFPLGVASPAVACTGPNEQTIDGPILVQVQVTGWDADGRVYTSIFSGNARTYKTWGCSEPLRHWFFIWGLDHTAFYLGGVPVYWRVMNPSNVFVAGYYLDWAEWLAYGGVGQTQIVIAQAGGYDNYPYVRSEIPSSMWGMPVTTAMYVAYGGWNCWSSLCGATKSYTLTG